MTMIDWRDHGAAYARAMIDVAQALAQALAEKGVPIHGGGTRSHQFAIPAARYGGGQAASKALRKAGFLACGIGLPIDPVAGDMNGLRIGTPEIVRRGVTVADVPALADLLARALVANAPETLAEETAAMRARFTGMHYVNA